MAHYQQISYNPQNQNSQQPRPTNNLPSNDYLSVRATTELASLITPLTEVSQVNEFISQLKRIQDALPWFEKQVVVTARMLMKENFSIFYDLNKVKVTLNTLRKNLLETFAPQSSPVKFYKILWDTNNFWMKQCIKQFVVSNCSKERPGSLVTETL